ncbi:MAG: hypothetical protein WD066_06105 [Planctomycetaceae bacterium]
MTKPDDDTPHRDDAEAASTGRTPAAALDEPEADGLPEQRELTPEDIEDEAIRGDFVLRWMVVLLAMILACTPIDDSATLLHVKTGEHIAANGWLPPRTDVFSYTAEGREWVNPAWLFDLLVAGIHAAAGPVGLSVLQVIFAGIVFGILVHLGRPGVSTWWGSVCAALALLACHPFLTSQPEIVTLLGLAAVLLVLHRWRYGDAPRAVWWLVPVFLSWANLDPRMFVGMALLVVHAAGVEIGALVDTTGGGPDRERRISLWKAIGASLAATFVNPFGWKVWAVPVWMYRDEYPALRAYGGSSADNAYLPLFDPALWTPPPYFVVAGTVLLLTTLAALVLSRRRLDWGQAGMFLAVVALAVVAVHELAAAALVCAAIAGASAQEWYLANFRQSYSLAKEELLFTRGGRAATVVAFVAIVFLGISGRLEGGPEGLGVGLTRRLNAQVTGLEEQLSRYPAEHRTFNFDLAQADLLIGAGRKVFIDRRIPLYRRGGEDLVQAHRQALEALRGGENSAAWKATFDRFDVVAAIPRLSGDDADYPGFMRGFLGMQAQPEWEPTQLGAMAAVLHRSDRDDPELNRFVRENRLNFVGEAFRQDAPLESGGRLATAAGLYARHFDATRETLPNGIQVARHHDMLRELLVRSGVADRRLLVALAYLTIREVNAGLLEDPDCALGYRLLGSAYRYLRETESSMVAPFAAQDQRLMRYFQEVSACQQALLIEPDWAEGHAFLAATYLDRDFRRYDLAQRELQEYQRKTAGQRVETDQQRAAETLRIQTLDDIARRQDRVEFDLEELSAKNEPLAVQAVFAYNSGFLLRAIELIEQHRDDLSADENLHRLYSNCLFEAGRLAEAGESLQELWNRYDAESRPQPPDLIRLLALLRMAQGAYEEPIEIWSGEANALDALRMPRLMHGLPMVGHPRGWPFGQTQQAYFALHVDPLRSARLRMMVAAAQLEAGKSTAAADTLRRIITDTPDTGMWPLARFYFVEVTGEPLQEAPPFDRIPITGDMFVPEAANPD